MSHTLVPPTRLPSVARRSLLRLRGGHDAGKVGMVELFFDLVFVFAVTQLSHTLLAHLGLAGVLQVGLLLVAVWWVWIYTSWVTNWLDPEQVPVRLALLLLMLLGLVMSAALPEAFGARAWAFALAYVAMQWGRTLFVLWAVRGERKGLVRNFQRILVWSLLAGGFWLAGAAASAEARPVWWALALGLEFIAPWLFFRVPGLGRSQLSDWDVDGSHLAERCALFIIIALGESLLVSGATLAAQPWTPLRLAAFLPAFVSAVAMWWLYFDTGAERAHHRIVHAADPGHQARGAYTYLHLLIVAGIILGAVGDELVLAHPEHADDAGIAVILGGPALYLLGVGWFKWVTQIRRLPPLSHLAGLAALGALAVPAFGHAFSALGLAAACTAVLVGVAAWEHRALRQGLPSDH